MIENQKIISIKSIFASRLNTLNHLLNVAETHFADEITSLLEQRIVSDMLPFGTQIAFTCNQPRHFSLWCQGQPTDYLDPNIVSLHQAHDYISSTLELLESVDVDDAKLLEVKRVELGEGSYLELAGTSYVSDFLIPNFYFHMTTAYNIMRMLGAPVGKHDFMMHLVPLVKNENA